MPLRSRTPLGAVRVAAVVLLAVVPHSSLRAQAVTTATIRGTVRSPDGAEVAGASVLVSNQATGYVVETQVVHGRYRAAGLEVGGPYTVRVRRIGYPPQQRSGLFLTLAQQLEVEFVLDRPASTLDTLRIVRQTGELTSMPVYSKWGTATMISDSATGTCS